jgi:hypothetical protein
VRRFNCLQTTILANMSHENSHTNERNSQFKDSIENRFASPKKEYLDAIKNQ